MKDVSKLTKEDVEAAKKDDGFYEINICAEHLARPFEKVCETLLHEMVHLYNLQIGVQDMSRGGTYHNKKYKEAAEQHGLNVEKDAKYGWTKTTLNDEAKAFVSAMQDKKFELHRKHIPKLPGAKTKSSTRKYVCPMCGCIIRATKEVHVVCGDCQVDFEEAGFTPLPGKVERMEELIEKIERELQFQRKQAKEFESGIYKNEVTFARYDAAAKMLEWVLGLIQKER